jgi:hypothetical protein
LPDLTLDYVTLARQPAPVRESATLYGAYLDELVAGDDRTLGVVAAKVRATLTAATSRGAALTAADVAFDVDDLRALDAAQREMLLNEWSLGVGRDDAPVLVIGAEHAYDVGDDAFLVNLCTEALGSTILWLSGGKPEVVSRLTGGAVRIPRPLHIHPYDHYRPNGSHTWSHVAAALGVVEQGRAGAEPGLGTFCHQIELSAWPSPRAGGGRPPTAERVAFLERLVTAVRSTASVLIIHGGRGAEGTEAARVRIASAFLGADCAAALARQHPATEPYRPIAVADHTGRRVIRTRQLSGQGASSAFEARLAKLVAEVRDVNRPRSS